MADAAGSPDSQFYPKTHAKELYCLTDKDLAALTPKEKRNPYVRNGSTMKLYTQSELEEVAAQKWGSLEAAEQEKQARIASKEQRALQKAKDAEPGEEEAELRGSEEETPREDHRQAAGQSPIDDRGNLHPLIRERLREMKRAQAASSASGQYVLYWMHTAVRDHENPALDIARAEAAARKLPLVVASFLLGAKHTYPTHRRYKFLLEGLQDVQISFKAQGLLHQIYVEGVSSLGQEAVSPGWGAVMAAVQHAALVITELMPTPPYSDWLKELAEQAPKHTDVWAVDTACIVPMFLPRPYQKAYAYRSATAAMRRERMAGLPYPAKPHDGAMALTDAAQVVSAWPWQSLDLTQPEVDITGLLKQSPAFDDSVPGVEHMPGGQRAGYARWNAFRKSGLSQYAARRNNPMLRSGVSRMSAYHHFGMVSPFGVAREAANAGSSGAHKFSDEFQTWRELAYSFCYHHSRILETLEVLPSWAQKTLKAHNGDRRELKTMEQLELGTTGDEIWDALQHQLNKTGELHNNVRRLFAPHLFPAPQLRSRCSSQVHANSAETALKHTIHLNHKYALDGCDPSSYGGILWCYGEFDGPKGSESTPIFGSIRNRPTHLLSRKLNAARFRDLALDGAPAARAAAEESNPKQDIRALFAQAGHQAVDTPGAAADGLSKSTDENGGADSVQKATTAAQPRGKSAAAAVKKRPEKDQPSIEKFFKRSKA